MRTLVTLVLALAACGEQASLAPDAATSDTLVIDAGPSLPPTLSATMHDFGGVPIAFPSDPFTVTVSNPNTVPLTGIAVTTSGTNAAEFAVMANSCTATLAPMASCTIDVVASATSPGSKTGLLVIATNGGTVQVTLAAAAVTGIRLSVSPGSQDFGTVGVGEMSTLATFTVSNPVGTTGPLHVSFAGTNPGDFLAATTCEGTMVPHNGTCTIGVRAAPLSSGAKSASLLIVGTPGGTLSVGLSVTAVNIDHQVITPTVQDLGTVLVGVTSAPKTFTVTNIGATPLTGWTATLEGANKTEFAISQNGCTGTLASSATCDISVVAMTTSVGAKTASLAVTSSGGTLTAGIAASSLHPPSITVSPPSRDFGPVTIGQLSNVQTFTITNPSGSSTGALQTSITGANGSSFVIGTDTCQGAVLAPAATCAIDVSFVPASPPGTQTAALNVVGSPGGTVAASLTGMAVAAASAPRATTGP